MQKLNDSMTTLITIPHDLYANSPKMNEVHNGSLDPKLVIGLVDAWITDQVSILEQTLKTYEIERIELMIPELKRFWQQDLCSIEGAWQPEFREFRSALQHRLNPFINRDLEASIRLARARLADEQLASHSVPRAHFYDKGSFWIALAALLLTAIVAVWSFLPK